MSRKYDKEFKLNAVKLVPEKRLMCSQVNEGLGIALSSLHRWLDEVKTPSSSKAFPSKSNLRAEDEERRHLKR